MEHKMYIMCGEASEVEKVIRENRIRINRGVVEFSPVKDVIAFTLDKYERLAEAVRAMDMPVNEIPANPSNDLYVVIGEEVESVAENVSNTEEPEMDDKDVVVDDITEVDLDADMKDVEISDVKDVPEPDAKAPEAVKKSTRKSKKTE